MYIYKTMSMKTAQELRIGNVILICNEPMIVQRTEYNRSGRNTAIVKMKLKNLLSDSFSEFVFKADEKFELIYLEKKKCTYSFFYKNMYVFIDEDFYQYEIEASKISNVLCYIKENMIVDIVFYENNPISIELPDIVIRKIIYTEPAIRGNTSNRVMKPAKINDSGLEINVPLFCEIGDNVEIDTRTGEYRGRVS